MIGRLVHDGRDYCGRLHQIGRNGVFIRIHVGVMRDWKIVERILNELKRGQPDMRERQVIGPGHVANRHRRNAKIAERREPPLEKRTQRLMPLKVDASNTAAPIIQIEVSRQLFILRGTLHCLRLGKLTLDVAARSEQSLRFASQHLYHHGAPYAVVGGASPGMP